MAESLIADEVTTSGGASTIVKELAAGTVAGWAQVMTGQPFDIVKVRLQSGTQYSGALDCATRILREEGATAFYKGTTMPLVGIGACVSLQFACLQAAKRQFAASNVGKANPDLTLGQLYLSGAFAGVGNSIASTPVEHIRIRLQTQTTALYSGPLDAIKKIHQTDGIRGVYKGQGVTLLREFHGYGAYFMAYEAFVSHQLRSKGLTRSELPMSSAALGGILAGYSMWLTMYPIDVIKSRMQTDGFASQAGTPAKRYTSSIDCAKQLWKEAGWKGFTKGLTPTLIRSPVVNGVTFLVFEQVMRIIG